MDDFDPIHRARDDDARLRAQSNRAQSEADRHFARLSPSQQAEVRSNQTHADMLTAIDRAVDARIARMVIQQGHGINVTGGNGNWTISLDVSALSLLVNANVNCDTSPPTITITAALK